MKFRIDEWKTYIAETYSTDIEYPWKRYPEYCVFRHQNNRKWFALIAKIPKEKLGLQDDGMIDILNLKLDPALIDLLRSSEGFFAAYHMNKTNWITVILDGTVSEDKIKDLIDMSFELTAAGCL